jgi:hypothetical protein
VSCSIPENLGFPTWTSFYQLHVLNDYYGAENLASEDSTLVMIGDTLGFHETMEKTSDLDFTTDPMTDNDVVEIGELEIDDPNPTSTSIPLSEVAPNLTNGYLPAPGIWPFTMPDVLKDDLEPFDQFQEISFISGQMRFSLTNNTCIWFGNINAGEPFIIHILDSNDNEILTHEFTEDIPPDGTITIIEYESLAGVTMYNEIKVLTTGGSRGSDGEEANVDVDATVDVEVAVLDAVAQYASAQIPEQTVQDTLWITLDENVTIYEATLSYDDQNITIDIANDIDLDIIATISIPNLTIPSGADSFTHEISIPASGGFGQTSYVTDIINIDGATIGDGNNPLDSLQVFVDVVTLDSGDDYREINANDVFDIQTVLDSLEFEHVQGILHPQEQDPVEGESTIDVNYPYINGEFAIVGESKITFDIITPIPTELTIDMNAVDEDGNLIQLIKYSDNSLPVLTIESGGSTVILNSDEYNINEFVSILPDSIYYTIYPIVGDPVSQFEYFAGDAMEIDIAIDALMDIEADCWVIPRNEDGTPMMERVNVDGIKQKQIDAFINASLSLKYNNTLGFSTSARILISPVKITDFNELVVADTTQMTVINVPMIQKSVGTALDSLPPIQITQDDLEYFVGDSIFVISKILLQSEQGEPLSGGVQMQGLISVEVEVSNDLLE